MNSFPLCVTVRRFLKVLSTLFLSALILLSSGLPALAGGTYSTPPRRGEALINSEPSPLDKGEARLDDIYQKSKDILKSPPPSMEQVQSEAQKGINEVQGNADVNEMYRPENSQDATTAAEQVEKALTKNLLKRD